MIKTLSSTERKELLEAAIARMTSGLVVNLVDASYCSYALCIGDFRELGLSVKHTWRNGMQWEWKGPGTICMSGEILNTGDFSQEIDMDCFHCTYRI